MMKDHLTQFAQGISLANARKTKQAQSNILFCLMIVNIMKAVMPNGKAIVWQTTQLWKISSVMKLLKEHFILTLAKQMKGNLRS